MKSHVQVAVIGGGVVGCSVLYHLTKAGWRDVVLLERDELTSGSTWHAAGGMHTINGDPNVAKLQAYTINLYKEIEQISGQSCGVHITGGVMLAATPERFEFLKMMRSRGPLSRPRHGDDLGRRGGAPLPADGQEAFRRRALQHARRPCRPVRRHARLRQGGAHAGRRGLSLHARDGPQARARTGPGTSITDKGTIHAEHVVNAGGLWAREVRPHGRAGAAGARHGAPVHHHRGHSRGRRLADRRCCTSSISTARSTCARKARAC